MPDLFAQAYAPAPVNTQEFTVSQISELLKRTLEDKFSSVRVRGEISGLTVASSGHVYFKLKDKNAVLDGVCWAGVAGRMPVKPEDGMEVICTGKISAYAGRSTYQLIIERMEAAGVGALLAMLEKRRKLLESEGLFAPERKRPLPFMPAVIGIVTSPTGAVIRDILHRLGERFPLHVVIWPVLVQGNGAAQQIANAINGFNALPKNLPQPDVLIIARGGGSIEDLWSFNEEIVVRAAAASRIPLISAVGHETDTTLIDFASDKRAPTPTAAAEIAVPVRADLVTVIQANSRRMQVALSNFYKMKEAHVQRLSNGLIKFAAALQQMANRVDRLTMVLGHALHNLVSSKAKRLELSAGRLSIKPIELDRERKTVQVQNAGNMLVHHWSNYFKLQSARLDTLSRLLDSYHYNKILARGFALVRNDNGQPVTSVTQALPDMPMEIEFFDGRKKGRFL